MEKQPSVAAEIRAEQKQALKNMPFKKKVEYFWEYYKVHTLVTIATVVIIFSVARDIGNAKDYAFSAMMLNSYGLDGDAMGTEFGEYAELDLENYVCYIDTTSSLDPEGYTEYDLAAMQRIMALVQTGDLDVMVTEGGLFGGYAIGELYCDLREFLSTEELAQYQGHIYYVDEAVIKAANEQTTTAAAADTPVLTAAEKAAAIESHRHPEGMKNPIPVGIFLNETEFMKNTGCFPGEPPVFGIIASSPRWETALRYLTWLWTVSDAPAPTDTTY